MSGRASERYAVVTGGGSGVGRAVAHRLAALGWRVAVAGRRQAPLDETAGQAPDSIRSYVCDVVDADAVRELKDRLASEWGAVDVLVAAAGINVVRRSWLDVSSEDVKRMLDINLLGAFNVIQAFLPLMDGRPAATVVTIVSDSGLVAHAKAGAGYIASKFGLSGLTESLNGELRNRGVRATAIYPGDIDTTMLDLRPVPPTAAQRAVMLTADDVAECVLLAISLPARAVLEKLVIRPR
jgi:NAD(P)-dependent dehydrogenase (short-subunit alcohol dehydrogenase family)